MKSRRHAKILELIAEYEIDTQEELLKKLNGNGFKVTQATVSRDIKELRLSKVLSQDGRYKYATIQEAEVPISDMYDFTTMLRSMTQGRGNFELKFETSHRGFLSVIFVRKT